MYVDWNLAGAVILSGLVIVFALLVILILVVMLTSRIVNGAHKKPVTNPANAVTVVPDGTDEEAVAVISAAVYAYLEEESPGVSYQIAAIDRAKSTRPAWGFAGMQQNTRPF